MRALAATALALALLPAAADAHAVLVRSQPARRAGLTHPPERVELWFNERLEAAYSSPAATSSGSACCRWTATWSSGALRSR